MKKQIVLFLGVVFLNFNLFASRQVVDNIVARVNGVNILKSDLVQPRIGNNGKPYSLDDLIMEEVLLQKAADPKRPLLPTPLEIERQIVAIKSANNLGIISDEEFEKQLKEEGFTLDMYKNQLARILSAEKIKHVEINEKIVITAQVVDNHCKKNPEYTKEMYLIKIAELPSDQVDKEIDEKKLSWENFEWTAKEKISSDLSFVFNMKKGEISKPEKINDQHQVVKLVDKKERRLRTVEERYSEVERFLQNEERKKLEKDFEKEIKKDALIILL